MRLGALIAISLVLAAPAAGRALRWYWPVVKVMRVIDNARIHVGTRLVRIDSDTTLCSGEGRSIRRAGARRWTRFVCTFTTFTKGGADRDLEFRVFVTGRNRYAIRDARWIGAAR
jgi:hypothetical protein